MRLSTVPAIIIFITAFFSIDAYCAVPSQASLPDASAYTFTAVPVVAAAIRHAKLVVISAYVMSENSSIARALLTAAAHGARVRVVLDGVATESIARQNASTARVLRAHGVRVELTPAPLHAKAAIVDGTTYLSDRNWAGHDRAELVLVDRDPQDRARVLDAVAGRSGGDARFATEKRAALMLEAEAIEMGDASPIDVETEAYTRGTIVERALVDAARAGRRVRMLVDEREYARSRREQQSLAILRGLGIDARIGPVGEKLAYAGSQAWIGSANMTPGVPEQIDWGLRIAGNATQTVKRAFDANWRRATAPTALTQ